MALSGPGRAPFDAAVVGAGVIGAAIARALALAGQRVVLVDRGRPGAGASRAAFGQIAPRIEAGRPATLLALWRASQAMYPDFIAALHAETRRRVEYRRCGRLSLALDEAEVAELRAIEAEQRAGGIAVAWLDGAAAREREPAVTPAVRGALHYPDHHVVDNRRLATTVALAAERAGVELRTGTPVTGLVRSGDRVTGVRLGDETIGARAVVVAAGAWSAAIDPELRVPVRPVRGQGIAFQLAPGTIRHILTRGATTMVHWATGRLIVGTTSEDVGFTSAVTAEAMRRFVDDAVRAVPAVASARFLDTWSGFRPGTPDDLPILGNDPRCAGLIWATGHYGTGIALAPVTAEIVADLVLGRPVRHDLAPFGPERFSSG